MQQIIQGDCLEVMCKYPDNHFNCVVTDPPYGIKFMGKKWDYQIPNQHAWEELLRICKPGTMMLCFGGTRTFHRLACEIENAGWEIRDCLSWLYGSGFPKSHNNFGIEGYGTALKPSWEPVLLCMKPLDGTFANNAEKWGNAGLNIDDSRIGQSHKYIPRLNHNNNLNDDNWKGINQDQKTVISTGRWPANLLLDETATEMLDQQSGISKSLKSQRGKVEIFKKENSWIGNSTERGHNDSGGASRFFYCAKASSSERNKGCEDLPLKEKKTLNEYINPSDGRTADKCGSPCNNNHPTVKPLKLMEYLIKLIAPPKPLLLDPFAGSGSTILAAKNLGVSGIGIEINKEYCEIARHRLSSVEVKKPDQQLQFNI